MTGPIKARILVADDQPDNLLVLEDMLEQFYDVKTVEDGQQVFTWIAQEGPPDLILLDILMPVLNGFDTCRRLKEAPETRDIPIIFLSGLEDPADEEFALSLGADDFIHKPFIAAVVMARVRNLLVRKEAIARERQIAIMESQLEAQRSLAEIQKRMIDRLSEMNSELERFSYVAAHDLREPCRTVVSYGQLLEKLYSDRLDDAGQAYLNNIIRSARRMYDLVGGLLTFSRSTANMGSQEPVNSGDTLHVALDGLASLRRRTAAEITMDDDFPMVLADRLALVQIWQNLLGNAMKFHKPDMPAIIAVSVHQQEDGFWRFDVRDHGIGFQSDAQDSFMLFGRMHHADDISGKGANVGVGLAITKRLVQAMGGSIHVESQPAQGCCFSFTLKGA